MPSPSLDVSVAWLCLCPVAVVINILALAVLFHFRPIQHSVDVALASLCVTMAIDAFLLLPFPAIIRLAGDLQWTKDACTFYNWLAATLRASNILMLLLLNFYWVSSLRTSPDPSSQSVRPGRIFSSSKLMKMAVSIAWVVSIIIGMVPVAGETRVFDYYHSDPYGQSCWFLPYNSDIGFSLFFIIIALVCLLISLISAGDTLLLFRQMRHYAVTKFSTGRRVSIPGHVTGVSQSDSPEGHPQHSELTVSRELCLVGFCVTLCSAAFNTLPFVVSQFVQLTHGDYDHVAMETTLLWLLLVEALVIPHLLWLLSARYRHALRYLWQVYVLRDASAEEEDATACTLQAFRMKAKDWNVRPYKNGSVPNQLNGAPSNVIQSNEAMTSKPGHSRSNGSGNPFVVKVSSPKSTLTEVTTSNGVLELDDGLAIVTSLPSRSGAMPLRDLSGQAESPSADTAGAQEHCIVGHVNILNAEMNTNEDVSKTAVESYTKRDAYGSNNLSPKGVWASRIAHKDGARLGAGSAMSQSTPTTPTKSLGISPIPQSRRIDSSSSSASSSNPRVKRSSSATSRQEWKERMRKKHLPAIFVNTSFEEDNIGGATTHHGYRSRQSSSSTIAESPSVYNVHTKAEVNIDPSTSHSLDDKIAATNDEQQTRVESIHYITEANRVNHLQAATAPSLHKQNTFENEGVSDMYEDGDIVDILDNNVSRGPLYPDINDAKDLRRANGVTSLEPLGEEMFNSDQQPLQKELLQKVHIHQQNQYTDNGIDNPAFDMDTERSLLPGSADPGVFYDDTLVTSFSRTPHSDTNTNPNSVSRTPHSDTSTNPTPQSSNVSQLQQIEASSTASTASTVTPNSVIPILPASSRPHSTDKRRILTTYSELLVSSVDKGDEYEPCQTDSKPPTIPVASSHTHMSQNHLDGEEAAQNVEDLVNLDSEKKLEVTQGRGSKGEKPSKNSAASGPVSVTQDWSQLESVSDSEMFLFKTSQVKTAAAVMLESSLEDEEEEDEYQNNKENNKNERTDDEGSSDAAGGQRVGEEEWTSSSQANLASFSTRENLNEVGQVDYALGSYDIAGSSPQPSPIPRERSGQGDGAESETDTSQSASTDSSTEEKFNSTLNVSTRNANIDLKLPNLKVLREAKASDNESRIVNKSTETVSNSLEYKTTPIDQSGVSKNTLFDSQDSISDSVFESEVDTAKTFSPPAFIFFDKNKTPGESPQSQDVQIPDHNKSAPPRAIHTTKPLVPKPVLSLTPTLPPTQKPPRGVGRRHRGPDTFARITSSEDELDEIFVDDRSHNSKSNTHPSKETDGDYDRASTHHNGESQESHPFSSSTSLNTSVNLSSSKTIVSPDQKSSVNESENDDSRPIEVENPVKEHPLNLASLGREGSVTLEPYGKRIPQWLEDVKYHDSDSSPPWLRDDGVPHPQRPSKEYQRPILNPGEENIVLVDRISEDYASSLKVQHHPNPQNVLDFRYPLSVDPNHPSQYPSLSVHPPSDAVGQSYNAEVEEYKLDSVDITESGRTQHRYKKNTRPSSSRPYKRDLTSQTHTYQYDDYQPPPPYFSSHDYITPKVQVSQQSSLTQYHFDEDIDRGFEEALSMDYHPFAPLPVPSHMSSLFAPGASSGLYFESISEEPEESLSLTEMAEASSLNGDSIFKTQAVISRPSSRASFTASSDNQQPDNLDVQEKSAEAFPLQGTSDHHLGSASGSDRTIVTPGLEQDEPFKIQFVPTSERTSADGSEAVEHQSGNGCHVPPPSPPPAYDSYSSAPAKIKTNENTWDFEESTSFFREPNSGEGLRVNSVYGNDAFEEAFTVPTNEADRDTSSPWLNLDILVTNGPDQKEDNPLDMSFGSDFSSDHTLAESFSKEVSETNDYEYELKKSLEKKTDDDLYTEFERDARPSTPQQFKNRSPVDVNNHDHRNKVTVSSSEQGPNVPTAYF